MSLEAGSASPWGAACPCLSAGSVLETGGRAEHTDSPDSQLTHPTHISFPSSVHCATKLLADF